MYNPDTLYNSLVEVVSLAIGSELSSFGSVPNTKPAIFKNRAFGSSQVKLSSLLPFSVITLGPRVRQGARSNAKWVSSEGDHITQIIYDQSCTISVYGGDSMLLCTLVEESLLKEEIKHLMLSQNIVVKDTIGVVPTTTVLDDSPQDFASLTLMLTTTGNVVETFYEVTDVDVNLKLRHQDSNLDLVTNDITIP